MIAIVDAAVADVEILLLELVADNLVAVAATRQPVLHSQPEQFASAPDAVGIPFAAAHLEED